MLSKIDKVPEPAKGALMYHKQVVVLPGTSTGRALSEGLLGRSGKPVRATLKCRLTVLLFLEH